MVVWLVLNFYWFLILVVSLGVIFSFNPVHSVLFLILLFCLSSCFLFTLTIDFMGLGLIIIYVGAIAVLFLFVIMMLSVKISQVTESFVRYAPISLVIVFFYISEFLLSSKSFNDNPIREDRWLDLLFGGDNLSSIGYVLYDIFSTDVVLASVILFLAMVSAVSLTYNRNLRVVKRQFTYKQHSRNFLTVSVQE